MSLVKWAPHAEALLEDIVLGIARELDPEDGLRWEEKFRVATVRLGDMPRACPVIPISCFHTVPPNADRLRQLIVKPYRIVYEVVEDEVHILSIRHGRMLVTLDDTGWN